MSKRSLYQVVGSNVQVFRKQRGLTQLELSRYASVDRSYLARLERGKVNPSIKVLCFLAEALSVRVPELVRVGGGRKILISP